MELGNYIINLLDKEDIGNDTKFKFENEYKGFAFMIDVEDRGKYSYLFDAIRIENKADLLKLQPDELNRRASLLCEKVTYLVEPFNMIELDSTSGIMLLRSKLGKKYPAKGTVDFFELTISCDRIAEVRRLSYNRQTEIKSRQPFNVTTDTAEKFIDHLIETVA